MEIFALQESPYSFLKLRISPWESPSVFLLCSLLSWCLSFLLFTRLSLYLSLLFPLSLLHAAARAGRRPVAPGDAQWLQATAPWGTPAPGRRRAAGANRRGRAVLRGSGQVRGRSAQAGGGRSSRGSASAGAEAEQGAARRGRRCGTRLRLGGADEQRGRGGARWALAQAARGSVGGRAAAAARHRSAGRGPGGGASGGGVAWPGARPARRWRAGCAQRATSARGRSRSNSGGARALGNWQVAQEEWMRRS
jgi:hypothetical protein